MESFHISKSDEYYNKQDPDLQSHFTVKTYANNKIMVEGRPINKSIVLKPNSLDPSYKELIIAQEDIEENQFNVVGEFVAILRK